MLPNADAAVAYNAGCDADGSPLPAPPLREEDPQDDREPKVHLREVHERQQAEVAHGEPDRTTSLDATQQDRTVAATRFASCVAALLLGGTACATPGPVRAARDGGRFQRPPRRVPRGRKTGRFRAAPLARSNSAAYRQIWARSATGVLRQRVASQSLVRILVSAQTAVHAPPCPRVRPIRDSSARAPRVEQLGATGASERAATDPADHHGDEQRESPIHSGRGPRPSWEELIDHPHGQHRRQEHDPEAATLRAVGTPGRVNLFVSGHALRA